MLKPSAIEELRSILLEEFGRDVDIKTARTIGEDLVGFYDTLAKIAHKDKTISKNLSPCSGSIVDYPLAMSSSLKKRVEPEQRER
ncbi:MAG: hypothetical protein HYT61_03665 [Candidatus Yanofskybacteria bacterium]|nr:hypothetical protein [Candidatus Yanofskybacteria bacterium]